MLIHKDLQGDAGGPEQTALKGLLDVGLEFMTDMDAVSTVQRSGQFVTMRRRLGQFVQLAAMFENPDARVQSPDGTTDTLGDDQTPPAPGADGFVQRNSLAIASLSQQEGQLNFEPVSRAKTESRLPRFTEITERIEDVDHATKNGKRRFFSLGDGRALLVRELSDPADTRYFMGVNTAYQSRRRRRVTGVQLVEMDPELGNVGNVLLEFDVHSGLGFDPGTRLVNFTIASDVLFNDAIVFATRAGAMWGRLFSNFRGDPSATYAVAEPALAKDEERQYLSLVAVHGLPEDSYDLQSSALYRLTCTYTTPDGVATSKITLPPADELPDHFYSAIEMDMIRLGPSTVVLYVVLAAQMFPGAETSIVSRGRAFFWSDDNGATWSLVNTDVFSDGNASPGISGFMARDAESALVFSGYQLDDLVSAPDAESVAVYELKRTGATRISTIPGSQFSAGLHAGNLLSGERFYPPYLTSGYGGGVRKGDVHQLWMQFDPRWIDAPGTATVLDYPGSRAQMMVSEDGGATWARRFLPQPWPQRVGFVVSLNQTTLAVPVYDGRQLDGDGFLKPVVVRLFVTTDGGQKWRSTNWRLRLPAFTWVDGRLLPGTPAYDIDDVRFDLNRGELFPLLSLRDDFEELSPMNPGRPWLADHRKTGPTYG